MTDQSDSGVDPAVAPTTEADLAERTRRSLIDLHAAIATLREMELGDLEPAALFDPSWREGEW